MLVMLRTTYEGRRLTKAVTDLLRTRDDLRDVLGTPREVVFPRDPPTGSRAEDFVELVRRDRTHRGSRALARGRHPLALDPPLVGIEALGASAASPQVCSSVGIIVAIAVLTDHEATMYLIGRSAVRIERVVQTYREHKRIIGRVNPDHGAGGGPATTECG